MNIEQLKAALSQGVVEVVFTKIDGDRRTMLATLSEDHIPPSIPTTSPRKPNPELLAVWDVENDGWRSMRINSIITADGGQFEQTNG